MAQIPFFHDQPDAWEQCQLGGITLGGPPAPGAAWGLVTVKVSKGKKLDIKQSPGTNGATITDQGYKPAQVTIELLIWDATAWANLQSALPLLEPPPNKSKATPFDVLHPATAIRSVKAVLIEEIEGPEQSAIKGAYKVSFKCVQFFPPATGSSATNTPNKSIPAYQNAPFPTPPAPPPPAAP